jgi:hypothetical protein
MGEKIVAAEGSESTNVKNTYTHMSLEELLQAAVAEEAQKCAEKCAESTVVPKIGDLVVITERGHTYESYKDKFKELGFQNPDEDHLAPRGDDESTGIVFAVTQHNTWPEITMVAIRNVYGQEWLIQVSGVEVVNDPLVNRTFTKYTVSDGVTYDDVKREFTVVDAHWCDAFSFDRPDTIRIINPSTDRFGDFVAQGLTADSITYYDEVHKVTLQLRRCEVTNNK